MKCDFCDNEPKSVYLGEMGHYCEDCREAHQAKWSAFKEAELEKAIDEFPERLDLEQFEKFSVRLAVHAMANPVFAKSAKAGCIDERDVSLLFKEEIIKQLPGYFSTWETRGHARMFHSGEFRIIGTVPLAECIDACYRGGILEPSK